MYVCTCMCVYGPLKDTRGVDMFPDSEQKGNNLKRCKGFKLKATTRIWS